MEGRKVNALHTCTSLHAYAAMSGSPIKVPWGAFSHSARTVRAQRQLLRCLSG